MQSLLDNTLAGHLNCTLTPPGGICEDLATFSGGVQKTLNTGVVTTLNFNRRVPTAVTSITFAHEAGHNFGSDVRVTGRGVVSCPSLNPLRIYMYSIIMQLVTNCTCTFH